MIATHHRDLLVEALDYARCRELGLPASAAAHLANGPSLATRLVEALEERGLAVVDTNAAEFAKAVTEQARPDTLVLWVVLPVTRELLTDTHHGRQVVADQMASEARAQVLKRLDEART